MRAIVLVAGFGAFACCLTFHVILWRVARPRSDVRALFLIFLGLPTMIALGIFGAAAVIPAVKWLDGLHILATLLLHWALSSAYIQSYPAVQARSPSLEIAFAVSRSAPRGLSREELLATVNTGLLVDERLEDLVANRLIRAEGERYVLTPFSTRLIRLFLGLRFVLGLPNRGG